MLCNSEADSYLPEALPPPSLPTLGACLVGAGCETPIFACCCGGEQDAVESAESQTRPGIWPGQSKVHGAEIQSAI